MGDAITEVSGPITGTGKSLTFETGRLAQQSQGAVVAKIGDTLVLATAKLSGDPLTEVRADIYLLSGRRRRAASKK